MIFKAQYILFTLILFTGISTPLANAQEEIEKKYSTAAIARPAGDSIMLRWAPLDYESWRAGIKYGYIVERYTMARDGKFTEGEKTLRLIPQSIKPALLKDFERLSESDNYAGVAAQAIYGNDFEISTEGSTSVIEIFNQASQQENSFSFALFAADYSPEVAKLSGLWYTDKNVKAGEIYLYAIYQNSIDGIPVDTAYLTTSLEESFPLPAPRLNEVSGGDKTAFITWQAEDSRIGFTAWELERSSNGGKNYTPCTKLPLVNTYTEGQNKDLHFYIDTLSENNKEYVYRLRGVSPFGERSPWSEPKGTTGIEKVKEMPRVSSHRSIPEGAEINWEYSEASQKLIREFKILRSAVSNREYSVIAEGISPSENTYTDKEAPGTAYYRVLVLGKDGSSVISYPVLIQQTDTVPPSVPSGIHALADTTGKVVLSWNKNPDTDIYGYRIYRGNAAHEEFSQLTITPVQDTFFIDHISLKTLSKKVFYKIMAIDQRQNHSVLTKAWAMERPDIVPPASPVIKNYRNENGKIHIHWVPSASKDAVKHILYRQEENNDSPVEIILNTPGNKEEQQIYSDSTGEPGKVYTYYLKAADKTGNLSDIAHSVSIRKSGKPDTHKIALRVSGGSHKETSEVPVDPKEKKQKALIKSRKKRNTVAKQTKTEVKEKPLVVLEWQDEPKAIRFIIYRATGESGNLLTYTSGEYSGNQYKDERVKPGTQYTYMLKLITSEGVKVSTPVSIQY